METRCAECQLADGLVINIIIAALSDVASDGCQLVEIMNEQLCDIGWIWDGNNFVEPVEPDANVSNDGTVA